MSGDWVIEWVPKDSRNVLGNAAVDRVVQGATGHDMVEADKPLQVLVYPHIISGAGRLLPDGSADGTAILYPCAHPVRLRARTMEAVLSFINHGTPLWCQKCGEEQTGVASH